MKKIEQLGWLSKELKNFFSKRVKFYGNLVEKIDKLAENQISTLQKSFLKWSLV